MVRHNKERPSREKKVNEFRSDIERISRAYRPYENFVHFLEAIYCAIARRNALDEERAMALERRYIKIVEKYGGEKHEAMTRMSHLLADLTLTIPNYRGDFLGEAYMTAGFCNERAGQFFTPYEVCSLNARMNFDGERVAHIKEMERPITVCDPACGAGAQIIAFAECLTEQEIDVQRYLLATLVDIDPIPFKMAYLQMTLKGIPAICIHSNSLSLEEWERALTPAAIRLLARSPGLCIPSPHSNDADRPVVIETEEAATHESPRPDRVTIDGAKCGLAEADAHRETPSTLDLFPSTEAVPIASPRRQVTRGSQLRDASNPKGTESRCDTAGATADLFASTAPSADTQEERVRRLRSDALSRTSTGSKTSSPVSRGAFQQAGWWNRTYTAFSRAPPGARRPDRVVDGNGASRE